jgi:hypothetical protein
LSASVVKDAKATSLLKIVAFGNLLTPDSTLPWRGNATQMDTVQTTSTNFSGGLEHAWAATLLFIPNFIAFVLILVVGYFVSIALGKVVDKVLSRVGFDRAVDRSGIKKALQGSGYHPSQVLGKIAFYTVFLFVLQLAFGVFGPNPIFSLA